MEIETETCDCCGEQRKVCGGCGSWKVTPVDHIDGSVTVSVRDVVLNADDGDQFTIKQVCWECGATCERTVTVEVEHG